MKIAKLVIVGALSSFSLLGWATPEKPVKQASIVAWLAPRDLENMRLVVNASSRERYTLKIDNPEVVEAWLKNQRDTGLVRVEVELQASRDSVRVLTIQPARTRRVPTYNSELVALSRGNG